MANKFRIKNDLGIEWTITDVDSLSDRDLSLKLVNKAGISTELETSVNGNVVSATFKGEQQTFTGAYQLVLVDNTGGRMRTIDKCNAFELVRCDCESDDIESVNIISASSSLVVGIKGDTGSKGEKGDKGDPLTYADLTEEEKRELQKPAIDAADELERKASEGLFNGKDGIDGYTPVKGVDYFDGKDGSDGADGKDGADGSILYPSMRVDSAGYLVVDVPDAGEGTNFDIDDDGYLCVEFPDL